MVSWWPGDGNANDIVGGNNGALQNGATFSSGEVGQAFSFDGANSGILIGVGALPDIPPSGQFTVDLWFNPANTNGIHTLFQRERSYLYIEDGFIKSFVGGNVTGTNIQAPAGQWTHAALTYNNSALKIYVNGTLAASSIQTLEDPAGYATSIGYNARFNIEYFAGLIDEVQFFRRALTQAEIQNGYAAGSAGTCKVPTPTITYGCYINSPPHTLRNPGDVRIVSGPSDCVAGETPISWEVFPVGASPAGATFDGTNIWVSNSGDGTITKFRASDGTRIGTYAAGPTPIKSVFDGEYLWIANPSTNTLTKIRASNGSPVATISLRGSQRPFGLAFDGSSIWVASYYDNTVSRLRLNDGAEIGYFQNVLSPVDVLFDGTDIWVSNNLGDGTVTKISESTGTVEVFHTSRSFPGVLSFDGSNVWVANSGSQAISKMRSSDGAVLDVYSMGFGPAGVAFDGTNMWIANDDVLLKYRASDGAVLGSFPGSNNGDGLLKTAVAFDGTDVWVSNRLANTVTRYHDGAPRGGLVAWYREDGNANDFFGVNNPSAVNAASFVPGKIFGGVSLGPGGYIDIPDSPSLRNQQFTISSWVRPDGAGPNDDVPGSTFIQKDLQPPAGDHGGTMGMWWSAQDLRFRFGIGSPSIQIPSAHTFPPGQFYHVAGTYDGSYVRLYVNGQLEAETAAAITIPYDPTIPWTIGSSDDYYRSFRGVPRTFNGVIDDVRFYDRPLSGDEIQTLLGLVAWYKEDGNTNDAVGVNNPSAVNAVSFVPGKVCSGVSLGPGGYIDIPDSPRLRNQKFTISTWVRPDGAGPNDDLQGSTFIQKDLQPPAGDTGATMGMWWSAQDLRFRFGVGAPLVGIASANTFPQGQFYHVVGTYDGAYVRLYVNGQLEAETAAAVTIPNDPTIPWTIGSSDNYYRSFRGVPRTFNGVIDEVRIYDRPLSGSEVQSIFVSTLDTCIPPDTVSPATNAVSTPAPNAAGWNNSDVGVSLSASDNAGGSGVKEIVYSASGAQTIPQITINGSSANLTITAEGESVITYYARDNGVKVETVNTLTVRIDKTAPAITCGAADGNWHGADVSIACTANGGASGLANSADSSFSLTTSVAAGSETGNASTNDRQICDVAGNCVTAGPLAGNKIDKKAPVVTLGASDGLWHANNVSINSTAMDGGSGLANAGDASFVLNTSVAAGNETANASTDSRNVCDAVGNCVSAGPVNGNKVDRKAPLVTIGSPDNLWHANNVSIGGSATDGGSGLANAGDANFVLNTSVSAGSETANASTDSRNVCDAVGNCSGVGPVSGNKVDRKTPVINLLSPAGIGYRVNTTVAANYSCADSGSNLSTCLGTVPNGNNINTALPIGPRTFTVNATDAVGNDSSASVTYTVLSPLVNLGTTAITFPDRVVGTTGDQQTIAVNNTGNDNLVVNNIALTGANAADFKIISDTCRSGPISPGNGCTITVAFSPTAIGGRKASLTISDDAPDTPHTVAVSGNGAIPRVYAWGWNNSGQVGDNTNIDRLSPVQTIGIDGVSMISAGTSHNLTVKTDGSVWSWGYNVYGQLGDGTTSNRSMPVQVVGLSNVISIAAGVNHSLALRGDGTVWSWGYNFYGQLGDNSKKDRKIPVQVPGLSGVISISAGGYHSLALKSDGTIWAWGLNSTGQLGDNSITQRLAPVRVIGLSGVVSISGGGNHSLALMSDRTVRAWGYNAYGQLGDGTTIQRQLPVQVSGLSGITSIDAGWWHNLALKSDGSVSAWGYNGYGQLGDGTATQSSTPVKIKGLGGITQINAGEHHSLALKPNGTAYAWGANYRGQLGINNLVQQLTPVQVSNLTRVGIISAGGAHTIAVNNDIR
jgi:alpha-tubulin suppressor-like RCC1 family protein